MLAFWIGVALLATLAALVFLAWREYWAFDPRTPLFLDRANRTRWPEAPGCARLVFVGDILLGDAAAATLAERGHDHPFAATCALLRDADLAVGNLEGPITLQQPAALQKRWNYRMEPEAAAALRRAGFGAMNLANNHILDRGEIGLLDSLQHLRAAGLPAYGAGRNDTEAHAGLLLEVRGLRIGLLGYVPPETRIKGQRSAPAELRAEADRAGAAWGSPERVRRDVACLRERGADAVVVSFHIGDRYERGPQDFEREFCRAAIDAGADAVIDHGSHILGPLELHRGRPILHGVGNYAFGSRNHGARFGLVAALLVDSERRSVSALEVLPIYTMNWNRHVDFQSKVLRGAMARRVLAHWRRNSLGARAAIRIAAHPLRARIELGPGD